MHYVYLHDDVITRFSALLALYAENPLVTSEFTARMSVMMICDGFIIRMDTLLNNQSSGRWSSTPYRSCDVPLLTSYPWTYADNNMILKPLHYCSTAQHNLMNFGVSLLLNNAQSASWDLLNTLNRLDQSFVFLAICVVILKVRIAEMAPRGHCLMINRPGFNGYEESDLLQFCDVAWHQRSWSTTMLACFLKASSHYLNQCWLSVNKAWLILWNSMKCHNYAGF